MPSDPGTAQPQRLHPSSLLFGVGSAARSLLLPGLVVLFASRGSRYEAWFMFLFLPAVLSYLVQYLSYRYRLGEDELVIREGLLTRNERHIPYTRIQNIDLMQNPLHRLLGVAVVRLETASGGKPEAVLRVLSMPAVEAMRERVFRGRDPSAGAGEPTSEQVDGASSTVTTPQPATLIKLPLRDIVVFGLISNRGMVVVAAALGLLTQSGYLSWNPEDWEEALPSQLGSVIDWERNSTLSYMLTGLLLVIVVLGAMRLLSVAWAIVKLYGFQLTRSGSDLRAQYGLLTRVSATIPGHRIQLLSTHASRLHRWFGRAAVQVETAGGGGDDDDSGQASRDKLWLAPILPRDGVRELVRQVLPQVDLDTVDWQPLAPRAWRRLFFRGALATLVITAVATAAVRPWGVLVLPIGLALSWVHATRWLATAGYALTDEAALFRSGWWGQRLSVVLFGKIQVLNMSQTPFDRRQGMASLRLDTAGAGRAGHRIDIPFLPFDEAQRIRTTLYAAASRTSFRW